MHHSREMAPTAGSRGKWDIRYAFVLLVIAPVMATFAAEPVPAQELEPAERRTQTAWTLISDHATALSFTLLRTLVPQHRSFATLDDGSGFRAHAIPRALDSGRDLFADSTGERGGNTLRYVVSRSELRWVLSKDLHLQCEVEQHRIADRWLELGLRLRFQYEFR